jgi:hypothetical protein
VETFSHGGVVHGVAIGDDGQEPIVVKLTPAEEEDDTKAPIWIVEIWELLNSKGKESGRWIAAADFKKRGVIVPVPLAKAVAIAKQRQMMRSDFVYRVRNLQTDASIMAAVL